MRTLSLIAVLLLAAGVPAAPALAEKPPKWEYAELSFQASPGRPARVNPDGKEIPATPATMTVRWVSADGEVEAKGWAELAEKLKSTRLKREGSASFLKIQLLNFLGSQGWELMEQRGTIAITSAFGGPGDRGFLGDRGPGAREPPASASTWLLKRRVP